MVVFRLERQMGMAFAESAEVTAAGQGR